MKSTELHEIMLTIIDHALTAKSTEFRFLRNWSDYRFYKGQYKTLRLGISALERGANNLYKKYCKGVSEGQSNFNQLLAYQQLQDVIKFYYHELWTITEMIYEYEAYLLSGNYLWAFLGSTRTEEDMRDFRE